MGAMKQIAVTAEELLQEALELHCDALALLNERYGEPSTDPVEMLRFLAITGSMIASTHNLGSYEELVIREGRFGRWMPSPHAATGEKKACYHNALMLALDYGFTYVEGYADSGVLVVPHAWCENVKGEVIDPTWDPGEGRLYLGIPMSTTAVAEHVIDTGYYGVLCNDWMNDAAVLKGGIRELMEE